MLRWAIESEAGCQAAKEESVATLCSAGSRTDTPDVRTLEYNGVVSFEHHKRSQPVNVIQDSPKGNIYIYTYLYYNIIQNALIPFALLF